MARIVHATPRYPPKSGGVETHVAELATRLVMRGHEVTVVTADAGGDVPSRETRDGVHVHRCKGIAPAGAYHFAPGVALAVRRTPADILHAHNYHALTFPLAAATAKAPMVATPHYHGGSATRFRSHLLSVYRPAGGWALRHAAAVVAVSHWEREQLRSTFDVSAEVVPNGTDIERFATAEPEFRDRPYLLTVGRLVEYKCVEEVIRALSLIPNHLLLVAGDGPYRDVLERAAIDAGVADRVEFLGFVPGDRLPGLYAGAEVHLNLSSLEAYGLTIAEALAAGTPCVVYEAGALGDWADREDCVGVTDRSPEAIATAVEQSTGRDAGPAGLLDWSEVTDRIESIYDGVLNADDGG